MSIEFVKEYYYVICIVILLGAFLLFVRGFESRKPGAREVVILAVMSAIAVASRAVFVMIPFVKPILGIIMITGIAFGVEAGFLTGAVSALVSNFIFGQGPWTPWQMFAMGMVGFVAGIIFGKKKPSPAVVLLLSIYGFVSSVLIYGGIMNSGTAFMAGEITGIESLIPYYMSGIVFDLIRAAATFLFLLILTVPVIDRLNRVLIKYC